jgi:hypothetical protein
MQLKQRGHLGGIKSLLAIAAPHVTRSALVLQGGVQEETPVLYGDLRRRWNVRAVVVGTTRAIATLGNDSPYGPYQNRRTRNRGFVKRGIDMKKSLAKQVLRDGIMGDVGQLWEK